MQNTLLLTGSFLILFTGAIVFYGYGRFLIEKCLAFKNANIGIFFCVGYSIFLCFCGYLELFKVSNQLSFLCFMAIGLVLTVWQHQKLKLFICLQFELMTSPRKFIFLLCSLLILIFLGSYLINLAYFPFNDRDDFQGYLVLAKRILEEGYQGGDVFNNRLIIQGFGGGNYVNAFFLTAIPLKYLHLPEAGLGVLFLCVLSVGYVKSMNFNLWSMLWGLAAVCVYIIFIPIVNISPILSAAALGLAILCIGMSAESKLDFKVALLLGLLSAGLTLLKGTLIVPAVVFFASYFAARFLYYKKIWVFYEFVVTFFILCAALIPWAYVNYHFFNTFFYPLLGVGLISSGGFGLVALDTFLDNLYQYHPLYLITLATWALLICYEKSIIKRSSYNWLLVFYFLSTLFLALTPGGGFRYNFIILSIPSLFYFLNYLVLRNEVFESPLRFISTSKAKKFIVFIAVITTVLMSNQVKRVGVNLFERGLVNRFILLNQKNLDTPDPLSYFYSNRIEYYQKIQNSVPPDATVLVVVDDPYLFDFSRNKIYVADIVGTTGFSPGMPFEGTSMDLAKYLLSNEIRYVVHTYKGWSETNDLYEMHSKIEWVRNQVIRYFAVNKQLLDLANITHPIYDNGSERVFDLCTGRLASEAFCAK